MWKYTHRILIHGKNPNRLENNIFRYITSETLLLAKQLEESKLKSTYPFSGLKKNINATLSQQRNTQHSQAVFTQAVKDDNLEKVRLLVLLNPDYLFKDNYFALNIATERLNKKSKTYIYLLEDTTKAWLEAQKDGSADQFRQIKDFDIMKETANRLDPSYHLAASL